MFKWWLLRRIDNSLYIDFQKSVDKLLPLYESFLESIEIANKSSKEGVFELIIGLSRTFKGIKMPIVEVKSNNPERPFGSLDSFERNYRNIELEYIKLEEQVNKINKKFNYWWTNGQNNYFKFHFSEFKIII